MTPRKEAIPIMGGNKRQCRLSRLRNGDGRDLTSQYPIDIADRRVPTDGLAPDRALDRVHVNTVASTELESRKSGGGSSVSALKLIPERLERVARLGTVPRIIPKPGRFPVNLGPGVFPAHKTPTCRGCGWVRHVRAHHRSAVSWVATRGSRCVADRGSERAMSVLMSSGTTEREPTVIWPPRTYGDC